MQIHEYINEIKIYQNGILEFLENDDSSDENFDDLVNLLDNSNIINNKHWLKLFLFLLLKISNNHQRSVHFFAKLERIILYLKYSISQLFTNLEMFNFFLENKRMLLILVENNIVTFDRNIALFLLKNKNNAFYFYPEVRPFIESDIRDEAGNEEESHEIYKKFKTLKKRRLIGENESYICNLIRNDSVEEFISYTTRTGLSLSSKIKQSPFETNALLMKKEATLIEYAAFFGSIEIFRFLRMNDVELRSSLWKYAIHSNNAEMIHLVEEYEVEKNEDKCYVESIKCHHNDIANYFYENYIQKYEDTNEYQKKSFFQSLFNLFRTNSSENKTYKFIEEKIIYGNFTLLNDDDIIDDKFLYSICKYNYFDLAEYFITNQSINVNIKYILLIFYSSNSIINSF